MVIVPESAMRFSRAALLIVISLAALLLSACGGSAARACSPRDSRAYAEAIAPIVNRFDSVEALSRTANRDELNGYVAQLQDLRQQTADLAIPACAEESRTYLLGRMDDTIAELSPDTPTPAPMVGPTGTPIVITATPDAAALTAEAGTPLPPPTETLVPTETLTPTPTFIVGPPRPTDTATATLTFTPDPDITTRIEEVWLCEWLGPNRYRWYEVEITLDQLTPVGEEILSGPYIGPWQSNCPATTPVPTATPGTPTAQPGG
jgi:hypothetical protein